MKASQKVILELLIEQFFAYQLEPTEEKAKDINDSLDWLWENREH
jgi:hypothetical protein